MRLKLTHADTWPCVVTQGLVQRFIWSGVDTQERRQTTSEVKVETFRNSGLDPNSLRFDFVARGVRSARRELTMVWKKATGSSAFAKSPVTWGAAGRMASAAAQESSWRTSMRKECNPCSQPFAYSSDWSRSADSHLRTRDGLRGPQDGTAQHARCELPRRDGVGHRKCVQRLLVHDVECDVARIPATTSDGQRFNTIWTPSQARMGERAIQGASCTPEKYVQEQPGRARRFRWLLLRLRCRLKGDVAPATPERGCASCC